jgi:trehalose 6-phosphate phosphatase
MKSILASDGKKLIRSIAYTRTLFAFDFDGTLAPIVSVPEKAKMNASTLGLIKKLADKKEVAIISGRSLHDLKERVGFKPDYLVGNHGLEGIPHASFDLKLARKSCLSWLKALKNHDWMIEDKTYSLSLHYRHCKNKKQVRAEMLKVIESLQPAPRVILGKSVINLIPKEAPHKGFALQALMKDGGYEYALFIGDDDTDEDVFTLKDESILSIRVGKKMRSSAPYYIQTQREIMTLLKLILENKT